MTNSSSNHWTIKRTRIIRKDIYISRFEVSMAFKEKKRIQRIYNCMVHKLPQAFLGRRKGKKIYSLNIHPLSIIIIRWLEITGDLLRNARVILIVFFMFYIYISEMSVLLYVFTNSKVSLCIEINYIFVFNEIFKKIFFRNKTNIKMNKMEQHE